jgi:hypothetical protein
MALIFCGKTKCPLCQEIITADDEVVATSAFIADRNDPLWQYSDAAFHRRCFASWEKREEFVRRFNETMKQFVFGNGKCQQMQDNGSIIQIKP